MFLEALDLGPKERRAFLDRECAGNTELRAEVDALLDCDRRSHDLLGRASDPDGALPSLKESGARLAIGPYTVLDTLGEGGMGVVYLAEQHAPIQRRVALKVVKWGMDTKQVVARFETERQALAMMDHPNIARVFDAGATEEGRPYFAMEHVRGEPITAYCDKNRLATRQRLELFLQVCEGVQHAHQKGIIHRDLKPSNVLVTVQGEEAVPKIIDFGVARATEQRLTERTVYTEMGQMVGTPEYMSPEQAEMTGVDIDTRTDVYSLGVLLYELLVGTLPFDPQEMREAGFDEMRRAIREAEPPKPSTRFNTLNECVSSECARRRSTDRSSLRRELRGDLDWITMKSLEKDRVRRYGSPSDLAEDVRRHLRHEVVLAGPPSALYRTAKFVRRHRFGTAAAAGFVVLLLGFAVAMTVQANRIARERDRAMRAEAEAREEAETARTVSEILVGLFEVADPSQNRGETITAREILDRGAEKIESDLAGQPGVQAHLMRTIGEVYRRLALYERSEPLLRDALETYRREFGDDHPGTLLAARNLARLCFDLGRYDETEQLYLDTLETSRRVLGDDHEDTIWVMHGLAWLYHRQGRITEAGPLYSRVLEHRRTVLGDDHPDTLWSMHSLAWIRQTQGRLEEAEPLYSEVLGRRRQTLGDDHPDTLWSMYALATLYHSKGRYEESQALHSEALATRRRVLGDDHPDTLWSMHELIFVERAQGHLERAEALSLEVVNARSRVLGENHPDTLWSKHELGLIYGEQNRHREAEELLEQTFEAYRRLVGEDHPATLNIMKDLGEVYTKLGEYGEALLLLQDALRRCVRVFGADDVEVAEAYFNLGSLAAVQGKRHEALENLAKAASGGVSAKRFLEEVSLDSLRGDPDFEAIVARPERVVPGN